MIVAIGYNDNVIINTMVDDYRRAAFEYKRQVDKWRSMLDTLKETALLSSIKLLLPEELVTIIGEYSTVVKRERHNGMIKWLNYRYNELLPIVDSMMNWKPVETRFVAQSLYGTDVWGKITRKTSVEIVHKILNGGHCYNVHKNNRFERWDIGLDTKRRLLLKYAKLLSIHNFRVKMDTQLKPRNVLKIEKIGSK